MSDDERNVFARAEEFLKLFKQGANFTKELLEENERLRQQILAMQEGQRQAASDPGEWEKLRVELLTQIDQLKGEKDDVLERLRMVEEENRQFATRYVEIAEESDIRAVVIYGTDRTFIAGADIREFGQPPQAPFLPDVIAAIEASGVRYGSPDAAASDLVERLVHERSRRA